MNNSEAESSYNYKCDKREEEKYWEKWIWIHKFERINLSEALEEALDMSDEEEVQIVLLPADNSEDGDTDTELGNELHLVEQSIEQIGEVSGKIEIQISK